MKTVNSIRFFALVLIAVLFLSSCEKDPVESGDPIQQGRTIIQINAVSPDIVTLLQVRYNNVIKAPIKATVTFHLRDGQQKDVQITIPANNKDLMEWDENKFINTWDYRGFYDSTVTGPPPPIDRSWDIAFVRIKEVSCPDKEYGFQVLTSDDWTFYEPKDSITSISFISNKDTISYADYDFKSNLTQYNNRTSNYYFNLFRNKVMMFSENEKYPLNQGKTMKIPLMVYTHNSRNYGSSPDGPKAHLNGSTIVLTITKLTKTHFDATFSGKLWSAMQADTLLITEGKIKNAVLPERVD